MSYCLSVDLIEKHRGEDKIRATIKFWGDSEAECEQTWSGWQRRYEFFSSAATEGRTIEELDEVDDDEVPELDDDEDEG